MFRFPDNLYTDVRIEDSMQIAVAVMNGEVRTDTQLTRKGAFIRVWDGVLWYTCSTDMPENIQREIDRLAGLAGHRLPKGGDAYVRALEVHRDKALAYEGNRSLRLTEPQAVRDLAAHYREACFTRDVPEMKQYNISCTVNAASKRFLSSLGSDIETDTQRCRLNASCRLVIKGYPIAAYKGFQKAYFEELSGHEQEILDEIDKFRDYGNNAVDAEPGEYVTILAPVVTAMFTHESFGHKSESDFMLNDKTLREEWVMGKQVGAPGVSIADTGDMPDNGRLIYDDEGTRTRKTYLIKDGVLTGRLHDVRSAVTLGEAPTGNSRAQDYTCPPIVRMTNTYMEPGSKSPEELIAGTKDGIYVYSVSYGTGSSIFTLKPTLCYRIRNGKLAEPLRTNVVTGNVFRTLFDIDGIGSDFEIFDTYTCGKNG
ncbi:MAG: TldD/PmbA family protein, partial [Abditibacteriota bacterium]|nr:TldD/PmbA family protein [Abditibacteriota bacterium]